MPETDNIERIYPEDSRYGGKTYAHHRARYILAANWPVNKGSALDLCCGSGYGGQILKDSGFKKVTGLDHSREAIAYASGKYPELRLFEGNVVNYVTQYATSKYDLVVWFEALEHFERWQGMSVLSGIKGLMKPGSVFMMSFPRYNGVNRFHISQWSFADVWTELVKMFSHVLPFGQDWDTALYTLDRPEEQDFHIFICWN